MFLCFITRVHLGLKWYIFLTYLVCVNQTRDVSPYLFSSPLFSLTRVTVIGVLTCLIRRILNIVNVTLFPDLEFRIDRTGMRSEKSASQQKGPGLKHHFAFNYLNACWMFWSIMNLSSRTREWPHSSCDSWVSVLTSSSHSSSGACWRLLHWGPEPLWPPPPRPRLSSLRGLTLTLLYTETQESASSSPGRPGQVGVTWEMRNYYEWRSEWKRKL